nr:Chain C, Histone-lysine N-methyltransferase, H3 lysine-79 specific [Homo sapiens]
LPASPAHQL